MLTTCYIEPQLAQSVTINDERYAAMIKLDRAWKRNYTIRVPNT
jgi:hypothetical protein